MGEKTEVPLGVWIAVIVAIARCRTAAHALSLPPMTRGASVLLGWCCIGFAHIARAFDKIAVAVNIVLFVKLFLKCANVAFGMFDKAHIDFLCRG
ncbi:MAG: hypothetical protein M0003_02665 [Acidithiobacillus sp.]|nr:hypothetical protein [Acidithiobacillus sp.]